MLTPFLLHRLSSEQFALWVVALTLLVAAPTLSLGTSLALLPELPKLAGPEGRLQSRLLVAYVIRVTLVSSSILAALTLLVTGLLTSSVLGSLLSLADITLILALLVTTEVEGTLTSALKSQRRFRQTAMIELAGRAFQVAVTLAVIDENSKASWVLAVLVLTVIAKLLLKAFAWRILLSVDEQETASVPGASAGVRRLDIAHVAFWSWVHVMSGIGFYAFDRWAVGLYIGPAALGTYAVCSQLAQLAHAVPAAAGQLLIPWVSGRQARALDRQSFARDVRAVAYAGTMLACLPALVLLVFGHTILQYWISPTFAQDNSALLDRLALVFLILASSVTCFQLLIGLGHVRYAATLTVFSSAIYMAAVFVVAPSSTMEVASLKLIYAGIALAFLWKIGRLLRR